ncbi:MAG: VOC family protein [Acidobacteria bacterium]|nr:VOC family protein [Acidobacteriota bacterium]MBI3427255.1 VOC family protein [Acidobacteriota bacterium]
MVSPKLKKMLLLGLAIDVLVLAGGYLYAELDFKAPLQPVAELHPTPLRLGHVVFNVRDLPEALQTYRENGFTVSQGGAAGNGLSESAFIYFGDNTYLELRAYRAGPKLSAARWLRQFGLYKLFGGQSLHKLMHEVDVYEDWESVVFQARDLTGCRRALLENGLLVSELLPEERRGAQGELITRNLLVPLHPLLPLVCSPDDADKGFDASARSHANGATQIKEVVLTVSDLAAAEPQLKAFFGFPPQRDTEGKLRFNLGALTMTYRQDEQRGLALEQVVLETAGANRMLDFAHGRFKLENTELSRKENRSKSPERAREQAETPH